MPASSACKILSGLLYGMGLDVQRDCQETHDDDGKPVLVLRASYPTYNIPWDIEQVDEIKEYEDHRWKFRKAYSAHDDAPPVKPRSTDEVVVVLDRKKIERPEKKDCRTLRLYHGTPRDRMECIMEEGLKSPCVAAIEKHPKGWRQEKDLIWFTDSKKLAEVHATYSTDDGFVIEADVEVCNPLPWDREVGDEIAKEINDQRDKSPCEYAKKRGWTDAADDGKKTIVRMAERCEDVWPGMGATAKYFGFDSFHQLITPRELYGEGAENWAVTDHNKQDIVGGHYVKVPEREDAPEPVEPTPEEIEKRKQIQKEIKALREFQTKAQ